MARRTIIHRYRRRRKPLRIEPQEQVPEEPIPDNGYDDEAPPIGIDLRTGESIFAGDTRHRPSSRVGTPLSSIDEDLQYLVHAREAEQRKRRAARQLAQRIIVMLLVFAVIFLVGLIAYLRYMRGLTP